MVNIRSKKHALSFSLMLLVVTAQFFLTVTDAYADVTVNDDGSCTYHGMAPMPHPRDRMQLWYYYSYTLPYCLAS